MFFVYRVLINLIVLIAPIILLIRIVKNKEDKSNFIYSTIELLNIKIKIDDNQNTKH